MLRIQNINGQDRIVIVCKQCNELILEDISAHTVWQYQQGNYDKGGLLFLHARCFYAYKSNLCEDESYDCHPINLLREMLYLEERKPLDGLFVTLHKALPHLEMSYQQSRSSQYVFFVATNPRLEKKYSISIDGGFIILDVDQDQNLSQIEINIPLEDWTVKELPRFTPPIDRVHLSFPKVQHSHEWIERPNYALTFLTNSDRDVFYVGFSQTMPKDTTWVSVSSSCFVAIGENKLQAMLFNGHPIYRPIPELLKQ